MKKILFSLIAFMCFGLTIKAQVDLQNGLVAYYPFNGNANDESGNGNNGTTNINVNYVAGQHNEAAFFNQGEFMTLPENSNLQNFNDFSFSFWINPQNFDLGMWNYRSPFLGRFDDQTSGKFGAVITRNYDDANTWAASNFTFFKLYVECDTVAVGGKTEFAPNTWVHYVCVKEGNSLKLFLNGTLEDEKVRTYTTLLNSFPFYLNKSTFFSSALVSRAGIYYDDVRIYNRALNEQEIQSLYTGVVTTVSTANTTQDWQSTFELPITTTDLSVNSNIISYQFDLAYDNTKVQYTGNTLAGTIVAGGSVLVNEPTPGNLSISYATTTPLQGAGDILKLQFKAIEVGTTTPVISNFLYNNTSANVNNGTITIQDVTPPTADITYSDADGFVRFGEDLLITATFSEPIADSPVPQIALNGANTVVSADMVKVSNTVYTYNHTVASGNGAVNVSFINGTDTHGNSITATPTSGASFNVIPIKYGDVDDNTFIRAYDAALVLQYSVSLDPLPSIDPLPWEAWRIKTADVDGVAGVTANDASEILKYTVGLINTFAVSKKSTPADNADVAVTLENGDIIFRSTGDLFGLNVFVNENKSSLGTPQILNANMLSATNISATNYAIGLATATAPTSGDVFMKIPFTAGINTSVTFDMIVNSTTKQVTVGLTSGIVTINGKMISVYPNPANSTLFVNGLTEKSKVTIYDLSGKMIFNKQINENQIDISKLSNGVYSIKFENANGITTKKFVKQ